MEFSCACKRRLPGTIRVNALASFALHWLLPRLADFQAQFPDIGIAAAPSPILNLRELDVAKRHKLKSNAQPGLPGDQDRTIVKRRHQTIPKEGELLE